MSPGTLAPTGDDDADRLLNTNPLALLFGMLLDQQIPIEWAFIGPYRLTERLGCELDPAVIATMDPDEFTAAVAEQPALHRFPAAMAARMQELCRYLLAEYEGQTELVWLAVESGDELFNRLKALPGFGDEKAKIFMAVLGKRFDITPHGWEVVAVPFADHKPRTVADIDGPETLARVRTWKKAQKAKGMGKHE